MVEKCSSKASQKGSWAHSKFCLQVWCQSTLQISNSFHPVDCCWHSAATNIVLLDWFHFQLAAFPIRYTVVSGIFNILKYPRQLPFIVSFSNDWDLLWSSELLQSAWVISPTQPSLALQNLFNFAPLLLLFLVVIPWYWNFKPAGVSHCN